MRYSAILCALVIGAGLFMGCEDESDRRSRQAPTETQTPRDGSQDMQRTTPSETGVPPATQPTGSSIQDAAGAAAGEMSDAAKDATSQINQVMQYIKDKKYDLAEQTLSKLEANKSSLPTAIQTQLGNARTMLNNAKAGVGGGQSGGGDQPGGSDAGH